MTDPSSPDILIVGAGPSGSVAAALLARQGWQVHLVDRSAFPRGKACGEFVNPGAVAALCRLDLFPDEIRRQGAAVGRWEIGASQRIVGKYAAAATRGVGISRSVLDSALTQEAVRAGATLQTETSLAGFTNQDDGPTALLRKGSRRWEVRPKILVGAGGLRCPIGARVGEPGTTGRSSVSMTFHVTTQNGSPPVLGAQLPQDGQPGTGVLRLLGKRTIGSVPLDPAGTEWNVTLVSTSPADRGPIREDPGGFLASILRDLGGAPYSIVGSPWGSGHFDRPMKRAFQGRVILVGDAAGYFDPFTGQGIYQAVRSAELAAMAISQVLDGTGQPNRAFGRYQATLHRERKRTRWLQKSVDWVLHPGPRRSFSLATIDAAPWLLDRVLARTGDTIHEQGQDL